jgi:hypothetical protein
MTCRLSRFIAIDSDSSRDELCPDTAGSGELLVVGRGPAEELIVRRPLAPAGVMVETRGVMPVGCVRYFIELLRQLQVSRCAAGLAVVEGRPPRLTDDLMLAGGHQHSPVAIYNIGSRSTEGIGI